MTIHAKWLLRTKDKMNGLMAQNDGPALGAACSRTLERDYFMTAEEALAYGIIDEIYQPRR